MSLSHMQRLNPSELIEASIRREEGILLANGAFCAHTGRFTGRSPKDKFFVDTESNKLPKEQHQWLTEHQFEHLFHKVTVHLEKQGGFVFDGFVNQHPKYRVPVRFYTEFAWHNLFVQQLFLSGNPTLDPEYTVYSAPSIQADPTVDGTRTGTFIVIHPEHRVVLIGGTEYAGELKKSIFTLMHHHLVAQSVMPMHCSASVGQHGDVALFFGLSGTGKTTLSTDPARQLIGDDEHGWGEDGVFNVEGGCYAKCIDLSVEKEPDIFHAICYGAVLENVIYDEHRNPQYEDRLLTENTRAAYSLSHIRNIEPSGRGSHPNVIIFLSADASGILPAVARLNPNDARRHFLLGYTSKLAGTERGVVHPEATFSACFGSPFLTDHPSRYAEMLMERIRCHEIPVYLLNTGWVGGAYGEVDRVPLSLTRELVHRIIAGELNNLPTRRDDDLFLNVPVDVSGIPLNYLNPQETFTDVETYVQRRRQLVRSFSKILDRFFV